MFTGLVEGQGTVVKVSPMPVGLRLTIEPDSACFAASSAALGDSISICGCCLTVVSQTDTVLDFEAGEETLSKTTLGTFQPGTRVNLERSLRAESRLGGHFVQGHVDTTTKVRSAVRQGADVRLDFEMPAEFACYLAYKGSVAINGVSLTVAEVGIDTFTVWIIPHTASATNLGALVAGHTVNLECDMLAKYTARILECRRD